MDRHGNLDNNVVPRVLVHIDVFARPPEPEEEPTTLRGKIARFFSPVTPKQREVDQTVLAGLWLWAQRRGVVLEAFDTSGDRSARDFLAKLEQHQQHPFRVAHSYKNAGALAAELPFRRDLIGVCDVPERGPRYGSWWLEPAMIY